MLAEEGRSEMTGTRLEMVDFSQRLVSVTQSSEHFG